MLVQFNWCIFFSLSSLALFVYNILSSAKYVVCNSMHKHKISLYNLIVILAHLMMPDHLRYYQTYSFDMKILNNMNYLHFHFIYICWLSTETWAHIERIQNLHFSFVPTLKLIRLDFLSIKSQQSICPSFFHYSISFGWYSNANF